MISHCGFIFQFPDLLNIFLTCLSATKVFLFEVPINNYFAHVSNWVVCSFALGLQKFFTHFWKLVL